jgi:protein required for attachment to host cells
MKTWSMIVADSARARFFSIEWSDDVELESVPRLVELDDLVNPEAQLRERDVFSDKVGAGSSASTGPRHAFEDHRDQRKRTSSERFARRIAERLAERRGARCVLLADKRMLGQLRKALGGVVPEAELVELAADLTRQSPARILETLVRRGILPAPSLPEAAVYRARGQGLPSSGRY